MGALNDKCRVFWFGDKVDIPAGWSEDENYRDHHVGGVPIGGTVGATGGGHHGHTGIPHIHAGLEQEHDIAVTGFSGYKFKIVEKSGINFCGKGPHGHTGTATHDSADTEGTTVNANVSADFSDTMPLSREAFVIKPDAVSAPDVPTDAVILTDDPDGLSGFAVCDGDGGRPDLEEKFILGCPAARAAGGAVDGAATHTHTRSSVDHTHVVPDHPGGTHAMAPPDATLDVVAQALPGYSDGGHYHAMSLGAGGATTTAAAAGGGDFDAQDNRPTFRRLLALLNEGSAATPVGTIVAFEGEPGRVPVGWVLCNGTSGTMDLRGCWIECTDTGANIGDPGLGTYAEDHDHAATSPHGHTIAGTHTHPPGAIFNYDSGMLAITGFPVDSAASSGHTHPSGISCSSDAQAIADATLTVLGDDGRTPYRQSHWIKYLGPDDGRAARGSMAPQDPAEPEPVMMRSTLQLRQRVRMIPICHVPVVEAETDLFHAGSPRFSPFDGESMIPEYLFRLASLPEAAAGTEVNWGLEANAELSARKVHLYIREGPDPIHDDYVYLTTFFDGVYPCGFPQIDVQTISAAAWNTWREGHGAANGDLVAIDFKLKLAGVPVCGGSYGILRLSYEYPAGEADPAPASHCGAWWRSYEQVPLADGSIGYLWGQLKWDRLSGAFVVAVESPVIGIAPKVHYGGRGASPADTDGAHGMAVTESLVVSERRGSVLHVSASGWCTPV